MRESVEVRILGLKPKTLKGTENGICKECKGSGHLLVKVKPLVFAECPVCWATGTNPITNTRPLDFTIKVPGTKGMKKAADKMRRFKEQNTP